LFIASRTPSIEKFKAYILAKVHNFLSEIMKKSCGKLLAISCICNQQQNTPDSEFLLEKYRPPPRKKKSLGKGYPHFIQQIQ